MVKQFVWQRPLRGPRVCLWIVALEICRVLYDVKAGDVTSPCDVESVIENSGRMVHPPLLQVGTLDKPIGLGVVGNHSPGVPCNRAITTWMLI